MRYYLAIKLALILIFLLPVVLGLPLPFAPIQIIVLELFMDLAASAGFTAEPKERTIYTRGPRDPKENVFNNRAIADIVVKAVLLFAAVTGVYLYAYQRTSSLVEAQTLAFAAWILGHILVAYVSRSDKELVVQIGPFTNRVINVWALAAIAFLLLGIYVPQLNQVFRLASVAVPELLVVFVVVIVIVLLLEIKKVFTRGSSPTAAGSTG
jgi:Ca2+-transporting ATPase